MRRIVVALCLVALIGCSNRSVADLGGGFTYFPADQGASIAYGQTVLIAPDVVEYKRLASYIVGKKEGPLYGPDLPRAKNGYFILNTADLVAIVNLKYVDGLDEASFAAALRNRKIDREFGRLPWLP